MVYDVNHGQKPPQMHIAQRWPYLNFCEVYGLNLLKSVASSTFFNIACPLYCTDPIGH